ncbi:MAG: hypothetical protein L6406_11165 [Desulfobacterales bacterium]|nr:hypothetical protein [Desulfobacterales bacterium]
MCELIQRKLDIKSTELPCLVIFSDIIKRPEVTVDLKRLTSEEIGKVIIDIFSHISKTIEDKSIWDPRFWESNQASVLNRRIFDYLSGKQINEQTLQDEDNIRVIKAEQITFANLISQIIENFNFESSSIS